MIIAKLNPLEEHLLEFSIDVKGTLEKVSDVRFVVEGEKYNISFPCKLSGNDVSVNIPKINETIMSGVHEAKLEVFIGDKVFTPLKENIEILEKISIGVSESVKVHNPDVSVSIKSESSDYDIVEEAGTKVLMKNGKYYGIIGEGKELKSKIGHSSLEGLVYYLKGNKK